VMARITEVAEDADHVPIGRPIANTTCYVLDEARRPVPVGIDGELYIGGPGLALGYLNRPELTAERFVEDGGRRWYRSGDLARRAADGGLEYLGRTDRQVKLRGFRIELGEIESVLAQSDRVAAVAVVAVERPSSGSMLVARVVPSAWPADDLVGHLRRLAAERLPRHMLPARYEVMDELPLTLSGKLDRRRLEQRA
jgi:acyl-coenzyme A synthetase/AMP-(fatty) acid ligase